MTAIENRTYQKLFASVMKTMLSAAALCRRLTGDDMADRANKNSRRIIDFNMSTGARCEGGHIDIPFAKFQRHTCQATKYLAQRPDAAIICRPRDFRREGIENAGKG